MYEKHRKCGPYILVANTTIDIENPVNTIDYHD